VFFPTVQAKTGLTGFPNRSDRFRPMGCRERSLNKEVFAAPCLHLFRCGKTFEVFVIFGEFLDRIGLTGLPNWSDRFPFLCEAMSNRSSLTGFRKRPDRFGLPVAMSCVVPLRVCVEAVGWVLLLGSVALQWLRELGKRSLRRCMSEFGFIGPILE
jgi:hypothetical protein